MPAELGIPELRFSLSNSKRCLPSALEKTRWHRKQAGLSQEELAVRASLHRTALGQLDRSERVARSDTLAKLAGCLVYPGKTFSKGCSGHGEK